MSDATTARAADLAKFNPYLHHFHLHDGRWVWLNSQVPSDGKIILDTNSRIHLPSVNVQRITLHGGIGLGFVFVTPLSAKLMGRSLLLHRPSIDVGWLIANNPKAKRTYRIQNKLLFFVLDDDAVMINSYQPEKLYEMLEL